MSTPHVTPSSLRSKKQRAKDHDAEAAYDYPMASFIEQAGANIVLVSDAVGTVGNGRGEAVSVSVDQMIYHTRSVRNGTENDAWSSPRCPSHRTTPPTAPRCEPRQADEGGGAALTACTWKAPVARLTLIGEITAAGIPVMGHVGVRKQKIIEKRAASSSRAGRCEAGPSSMARSKWPAKAPSPWCWSACRWRWANHHPQPRHPHHRDRLRA